MVALLMKIETTRQKMTFKERIKSVGPTALLVGGMVGPGSITTATVIGVNYGFALLWVVLLAMIFQFATFDMTGRLALAGGKTYQEALREDVENPTLKKIFIGVILVSITITSLAFMTGNLTGAGLGLELLFPSMNAGQLATIVGIGSVLIISTGSYKTIEKIIKYLIFAFVISFGLTAIITRPDIIGMLKGLFIPRVPEGSWSSILAIFGTTGIGGYSLFLHTNAIKEKWSGVKDIDKARNDIFMVIPVSIITHILIIISASSLYGTGIEVDSAAVMGEQFTPLFGSIGKYVFAVGLFSAGISSVIPLTMAFGWIITGLFGVDSDLKGKPFRIVSICFLGLTTLMVFFAVNPVQLIISMQIVSAVLGPLSAGILLYLTNKKSLMKEHTNSRLVNVLVIIAIVTISISALTTLLNFF